jgi:hypothetical protein
MSAPAVGPLAAAVAGPARPVERPALLPRQEPVQRDLLSSPHHGEGHPLLARHPALARVAAGTAVALPVLLAPAPLQDGRPARPASCAHLLQQTNPTVSTGHVRAYWLKTCSSTPLR